MTPAPHDPRVPPATVLLIDDDADTRAMYELVLAQNGFHATSAATAEDGLTAARELKPAIIVADVGAPGRATVFQMMRALRGERQTRRIPVIAVTGYDLPRRAHAPRFQRVLLKPVPPDALVDSVRTVLTRSARMRCPRCGSLLMHSVSRSTPGVLIEEYRPCRNGCGFFYYDPDRRRMVALIEP